MVIKTGVEIINFIMETSPQTNGSRVKEYQLKNTPVFSPKYPILVLSVVKNAKIPALD